MLIREYTENDLTKMIKIWNTVVDEGNAFPQEEVLDQSSGELFFGSQNYCGRQWRDCWPIHSAPQ